MSNKLVQRSSLSNPDPKFWGFSGTRATKELGRLFAIGLYDLQEQEYITYKEPLNGAAATISKKLAVYNFTTPPQSYEISEPSSVQIVPTQDGGKFTESQGSIFKDIKLAGTVGFRPTPITNELFPGLEEAGGPSIAIPSIVSNLFLKDSRGLNPKEVTGFDELIFLRNLFRAYWDMKSDSEWAKRIVMIFVYTKESEVYIVEPLNFTTSRDKSSPLSWRYNISLRTMYHWDQTIPLTTDSLKWYQSAFNAIKTLKKVAQDLSSAIHQVAGLINYLANLPANILNGLLSTGMSVLNGIAAVRNAGASFPETVTQSLVATLKSYSSELRELFDEKYSTVEVMEGNLGSTRHALIEVERCANCILALDSLWASSKQVQVSNYSKAYLDEFGDPPYNAGSPLTVQNIKFPESAIEVEVVGLTSIRALAKQYLGDAAKWKMLVMMNNLRPPYVSAIAGDGVLSPGSKLIIPLSQTQEAGGVSRAINTDQAMEDQSLMMKKYGRDLLINDSGTGVEGSDLQVSQSGDLNVIEGVANVEQAMQIKFATEQGELSTHPDFGAKYPMGTKITMLRIQEFYISTRRTLLSDFRVESISSMKVLTDGDRVYTSSKLKLKDTDQELPITFAVRR